MACFSMPPLGLMVPMEFRNGKHEYTLPRVAEVFRSGIPPGQSFDYVVPTNSSGQWGTYWVHAHSLVRQFEVNWIQLGP
jgi:Multicopper oxidase